MLSFQPGGVWQVLSWRDGIDGGRGEKFCLPSCVGNLESIVLFPVLGQPVVCLGEVQHCRALFQVLVQLVFWEDIQHPWLVAGLL